MRRIRRRRTLCGATLLATAAVLGVVLVARPPAEPVTVVIGLGQPLAGTDMVVDASRHLAYIASTVAVDGQWHSQIAVVDTLRRVLVRRIAMGTAIPTMALDRTHGRVVVADETGPDTGIVRLLDASSGAVVRTAFPRVAPVGIAVDGRVGRVFVVGQGRCQALPRAVAHACRAGFGVVDILDEGALRPVGAAAVGPYPRHIVADEPDGRVFVSSSSGVAMLDARSGHVLRTFGTAIGIMAVDTITRRVFVEDNTWTVRLLDARSGRFVGAVPGTYLNAMGPASAAAIDEHSGNLIIKDDGRLNPNAPMSTVSIVDGRTGHLLHTLTLGAPPAAVAVDAANGQAFVVVAREGDDGIRVVDMRSGRVVRTIQAVPPALSLAVDDRAGRLLVTSAVAPGADRPDPWAWIPVGLRSRLPSWLPVALPPPAPATPPWLPRAGSVGVVDLTR